MFGAFVALAAGGALYLLVRDWPQLRQHRPRAEPRPSSLPVGKPQRRASIVFDLWPRVATRWPLAVLALAASLLAASGGLYAAGHGAYGDALTVPGAESQELITQVSRRASLVCGQSVVTIGKQPSARRQGQLHHNNGTIRLT